MKQTWTSPDSSLFFSKKDSSDVRLGDCVQAYQNETSTADLILWGYPDHEGISLNKGRVGAAEAPRAIRTVFYKMTPHVQLSKRPQILDAGDVSLEVPLKERHDIGASRSEEFTKRGVNWVALGGGHDYGYADGSGFLRASLAQGERPIILNFDAHLDVRPSDQNLNSGTAFYRLLSEFQGQFDFFEVGLQPQCNSRVHWNWAREKGTQLISLEETFKDGLVGTLKAKMKSLEGRPLFVSLDIDALTSMEAPGCSQSWTTGLKTDDLMQVFLYFQQNFSWKSFGIYEVSPPLDSDLRTVKLAALFLHRYLSLKTGATT